MLSWSTHTHTHTHTHTRTQTHTHIHTYTLNGRLLLRSARSVLAAYRQLACKHLSPSPPGDRTHIYTPLRVSARDPRCARATSFLLGTMLHRLAPAAFDACMWGVAPAALGASGAWQLRRLATVVLGAIFCLGCHRDLQRPPKAPRQCFQDVARVISSRYITSGHTGRFQPAPTCYSQLLFPPLPVWFGLSRPLEASRGPNEPQISVFGMFPE